MTISPTILIIAAIIAVMLIVVAFLERRGLSNENDNLTRKIIAYMTAFGEVDAEAKAMAKKIDDEMQKKKPSAEALAKRQWRAERVMIVSPNGTKRYVPKFMCDRVPSEKQFGRQKWVLKPEYLNKCPEVASGEVEINPRTGKPYKTSKTQREASKKWAANHPESGKESRRRYMASHAEEHREKYVQLWYNGRTRTARKDHCHRGLGKQGKEKWEVLPEFSNLYAWCRGDQDEKKNA